MTSAPPPPLFPKGRLPHGSVYLISPEHDASVRRRDLEGIASLGFNTVVFWPPASRWDAPEPGGLAFDSIDHAMSVCVELGLSAIIELQGQDDNHGPIPEYLPFAHEWPNINHPLIREATLEFLRSVARHFRGHPALLGYCTFNEVHYTEADPWSVDEFVRFLERQYGGDIRALNAAWCTFHRGFDEIPRHGKNFRRRIWSSGLMQRDWFRFQQHNYAERLGEWYRAVREEDPAVTIFADILGCDSMHNRTQYGANDWLTAAAGDVHGLSCYANMLGPDWRTLDAYSWSQFWRQQLGAARGKQTIISELMTHNRSMFPAEGSSMTDQLGLWSHQALYNGIQGLIYWKYRPFIRGVQVAGRGLTNTAGEPTALAEQARRAAAFSARHSQRLAASTPDHAGAAIVHDHDTQDLLMAIQAQDPAFYVEAQRGIYRGFWEHAISPRYVTPADLVRGVPADIRVLAFPCDVCLSAATAAALIDFVRRGGVLFTEGRFGLLDPNGYVYDRIPGAGLRQALGVGEVRFTCDAQCRVQLGDEVLEIADHLQELELDACAEVVVRSERGQPVLVESRLGSGRYVHAPLLLGRAIQRGARGALALFAVAFERLRPALAPAVCVLHKPPMVDVSVLVDARGEPTLIGICNYRNQPSDIELVLPASSMATLEEGAEALLTRGLEGGASHIRVSARQAVAILLDPTSAALPKAG
jgi:beta-galactosidase